MYSQDFLTLSRHTILSIDEVVKKDNVVKAVLTVSHFNRITQAPYWFTINDYQAIKQRGYI